MSKIEFNTQIVTTIEQSKRLLELGLKPETSDMLILPLPNSKELIVQKYEDKSENLYYTIKGEEWESSPAWSLHRLFAMICNYPCKEHFIFEISMDYDSMVDVYDSTIEVIERHIKENNFNKDYLK